MKGKRKSYSVVKMEGDAVRLAEALLAVTKALEPLPEAERGEVLRAACIMYGLPVLGGADGGAKPKRCGYCPAKRPLSAGGECSVCGGVTRG